MRDAGTPALGRPRADLDETVFAATLRSVDELGYSGATMDRIAAAAGVAKTTLYRRWPSKGVLITECLVHTFGAVPDPGTRWLPSTDPREAYPAAIRWVAGRIGEPGVGAAFAGVFTDAISDPGLREFLLHRLQDPYRDALQEALGESTDRFLLHVDVIAGTLLHRLGIRGAPMADGDVEALITLILRDLP